MDSINSAERASHLSLIPRPLASVISEIIYASTVDTEIAVLARRARICRFTPASVHQNSDVSDRVTTVRTIDGVRSAVATTNQLTSAAIKEALQTSLSAMRLAAPSNEPELLASARRPLHLPPRTAKRPSESLIGKVLKDLQALGKARGIGINGSLIINESSQLVKNSSGVDASHSWQDCSLRIIADNGHVTGYASCYARDLTEIDHITVAEQAIRRAENLPPAPPFKPGTYRVLLAPDAVADIFVTLSAFAFSTKAIDEKRSIVSGMFGKKLIDERFTLKEVGGSAGSLGPGIDPEGIKKRPVVLIERGIVTGMIHDSASAKQHGVRSTGHALRAPNPDGPFPSQLEVSFRGLQKAFTPKNCFEITRFNYTNIEHEKELMYTGLTRDGTFFIDRNGRRTRSPELRFTVSIPKVLNRVQAAFRPAEIKEGFFDSGFCKAPALLIDGFDLLGISAE